MCFLHYFGLSTLWAGAHMSCFVVPLSLRVSQINPYQCMKELQLNSMRKHCTALTCIFAHPKPATTAVLLKLV